MVCTPENASESYSHNDDFVLVLRPMENIVHFCCSALAYFLF